MAERQAERSRIAGSTTSGVRIFGYHPELDGLRGLAILGVLATHSFNSRFPGGGIGVDVFFFLSGFLITSLLLNEWSRHGRIDLKKFWMRRALRLIPALLIFIPAAVAVALLIDDDAVSDAISSGLSTLFYMANIWRILGLPAIEPLRHTWSLSIEEQFYLLWPVGLWLLLRRGTSPKVIAAVTAIPILLLPLWRIFLHYQVGVSTRRIRFGPDTRADVLLMGCVLAMILSWHLMPKLLESRAARYALWPGLGFLGAWVLVGDEASTHVLIWGYTATGVACAILVINAISTRSVRFRAILRWRPLAWLGKVSYGFYLWHYLVISAIRKGQPAMSDIAVLAIAVPVALILTTASWRLVEKPFLKLKGRYSVSGPPATPVATESKSVEGIT